ncbi:pilus assembly protein [Bosea sp. NBC_00550]|uniref:pilus assembly protein n=1 Tax=Bosea sp. NBC_00550 TaxID=2969621 RepID=UPI0022329C34|nr:pilus assembly protein [Bosea sp. NBC_00550]UZF95076.1 VWA domain-containing protein [Bosea sp. NBC_00550]
MFKVAFLSEMMRRFRRDQRGNVLVMAGFLTLPLVGILGITVDYSRASNARQALSSAIDSASLMAARDAQKLTDGQLKERVDLWIRDNLPASAKSEFAGATVVIDRTARTIKISANSNVPTTIGRVLGPQYIAVASDSQSTWGTNKIELALALDNTGSMSNSSKMTNLKTAAKSLLKIMKDAAIETDQIRVSIVPFNTQVRIARSFKDEQWMRYGLTRQVNCRDEWKNNKWVQVCDTETMTKSTWSQSSQGCITDRDQNYDTTDGGSYSAIAQQYPAYWCSQSSLAEIMPLSSDWTALEARIDTMTPVGNTNVTIGAVWGWATLSQSAPFTEAKPTTEPRLKKYMILLTDGDNTENRFTKSGNAIDDRTRLACANAKSAGINLYTIRVIDGDAALLKECASKPEMYYEVTSASQLDPVFRTIANEISAVRLTH